MLDPPGFARLGRIVDGGAGLRLLLNGACGEVCVGAPCRPVFQRPLFRRDGCSAALGSIGVPHAGFADDVLPVEVLPVVHRVSQI